MADPYSNVSVVNFNTSPPPDDGTQSDANEITWAKHLEKLAQPLKTALEAVDSNIDTAFGRVIGGGGVTSYGSSTTVASSDQGKLVRASTSGITITTPDASSVQAPFVFAFQNGAGDAGNVVLEGSGAQTVDGLENLTVADGMSFVVFTDGSNWFTAGRGVLNKHDGTTAPASTDDVTDGFAPGSLWIDVTGDAAYVCVDASDSVAVWDQIGGQATTTTRGLIRVATQTEMEATVSNTLAASPGNVNWHPGVAKAWAKADTAGGLSAGHNIGGVTDTATGRVTIGWDTDFSISDYSVVATIFTTTNLFANIHTQNTLAVVIESRNSGTGNLTDPAQYFVAAFGDQ